MSIQSNDIITQFTNVNTTLKTAAG